jgi:hypothetical protein
VGRLIGGVSYYMNIIIDYVMGLSYAGRAFGCLTSLIG